MSTTDLDLASMCFGSGRHSVFFLNFSELVTSHRHQISSVHIIISTDDVVFVETRGGHGVCVRRVSDRETEGEQ